MPGFLSGFFSFITAFTLIVITFAFMAFAAIIAGLVFAAAFISDFLFGLVSIKPEEVIDDDRRLL